MEAPHHKQNTRNDHLTRAKVTPLNTSKQMCTPTNRSSHNTSTDHYTQLTTVRFDTLPLQYFCNTHSSARSGANIGRQTGEEKA